MGAGPACAHHLEGSPHPHQPRHPPEPLYTPPAKLDPTPPEPERTHPPVGIGSRRRDEPPSHRDEPPSPTMTRPPLRVDRDRMICDRCLEARHYKCGGRAGCTCPLCTDTAVKPLQVRAKRVRKLVRDEPPSPKIPQTQQRVEQVPCVSRQFTAAEIRAAADVVVELGAIIEQCRVNMNMPMRAMAMAIGIDATILRRATRSELPQGLTGRSTTRVLTWMADNWA